MAKKPIKVSDATHAPEKVPVRRRTLGKAMTSVNISLPVELHQTINGIVATTSQSRSMIITELIEKGLK